MFFTPPPPQQRVASSLIGSPVEAIGSAGPYNSNTSSGGTTADIPSGSAVIVLLFDVTANDATYSLFSDSVGESWTLTQGTASASVQSSAIAYSAVTASDMPIGTTFKVTTSNGDQWVLNGAWYVVGASSGVDKATVTNNATAGTSNSQSSGTLAQANEIIYQYTIPQDASGGVVSPSNFTNLFNNGFGTVDYKIVAATTSITAAVTWTGTSVKTFGLISFKH